MNPLVCSILISMMIMFLGCDTPNTKPVSENTSNKEGLTVHEKRMIDAAWATGQLSEKNWGLFLERLRNEPDRENAVQNALSSSFKARFRRSYTKWKRRLLTPPQP